MKNPILLSVGLIASALLPATVHGASIPGLFNTGVADNGALLANGAVDPHYRLVQSPDATVPGPNAFVVNDTLFPIVGTGPWLASGPASKWIGPMANQSTGNLPGDYRYRITFDLTGFEPATAVITGRWTSDNGGAGIFINGVSTGISGDGNFGAFSQPFTINAGFVEGTNTLDFVVNNGGTGANPTGFRAEISGTADPVLPPGIAPTIVTHPVGQTNGLGESASFTVRATGSRPLGYQWRFNGSPISGATNTTLTLNGLTADHAGAYDAVVSNEWGSATSDPAQLGVVFLSPAQLSYEGLGPTSRRTGLAFSEIMYHPSDRTDGRNLEFIELYNSNPFAEDIGGYRLSGDVDYVFPANTTIAGNGFLVIAAAPADVEAEYGISGVLGGWANNLPNDGGTIQLRKRSDAIVLELEYSDEAPWPVAADGAGPSLVLARASYGEANPRAWAASALVGGSPGAADPVPVGPLENIVINEAAAHLDDVEADFIELYNAGPLPQNLSGCFLSDARKTNLFLIPTNTIIAPFGFAVFDSLQMGFALRAAGETVYFWNPERTRIIDAVRWDDQGEDFSWGRYPDGTAHFFPGERTRGTNNTVNRGAGFVLQQGDLRDFQVVINEVMYNPLSGDENDEYVELYNASTNGPVNLGGWELAGGVRYTFPSNAVLPALGYIVVARNAAQLLAKYPHLNAANTFGDWDGSLANGGERLRLLRPELLNQTTPEEMDHTTVLHIAVDEVTYADGGRWPAAADGGGSSLELIDPRSPWRLAPNWAASDESAKAGWTLVEATGPLNLVHPDVPSADQLQVMLQGPGEALVDEVEVIVAGANRVTNPFFETGATGWFFQGTHRRTFWDNTGGFNSAGALHLVATERGDHVANRVRTVLSSVIPQNTTVTIRAKVRWLSGHPEVLFRLRNGGLEAVGQLAVPGNLGTPAQPNSRALANAGPAIVEVGHRPILPAPGQAIRVSARVQDPDGVAAVTLRYRIDPSATLASVPMTDDGLNGDALPGDGVYTGIIPGQPNGTLIAFHVAATDAFTPAASALFPDDAPKRECLVRVGETTPASGFGTYRFWLTQASHNFWGSREKMSNEDVDATFVYGTNRVVYNAGGHFSGSSYTSPGYTTPTGALCGYDLNFPDDDAVLGETHFTLDWPIRDDTNQREQLMYWFLEQYGLPNMYRRYVNLYVNGVKRGTIYDDVQQPGGDAIESWFPDDPDGTLLKTDCWNEFDDGGTRTATCVLNTLDVYTSGGVKKVGRYRWNWRPRAVRGTANDFSDLFALIDAANAAGAGYQNAVEAFVDVEHWMRTFAMNDLASFWDAFGNPNAKNTYLYKPENDGWKLFCWDFDVGLGVFNDPVDAPLFAAGVDQNIVRMYNYPAFVRLYWQALDEAVNGFFQAGAGTAIDRILDGKYAAFQASGIGLASPANIKNWITQRRAFLIAQLNTVSGTFNVTTTNNFSTNRNLVTISGTAPVRAHTITVNGVPYPVAWTSVTAWRLAVPVTAGVNELNLAALDRFGQPLPGASRTVTVEYTGADAQPEDFVVINEIMYNPAVPESSFIELHNASADYAFDLSNWRLNGADFTFPPGTVLTNGQFLVIAKNRQAFASVYGMSLPVLALFGGQLDDGGETLSLVRPGPTPGEELLVDRVTYDDDPPWPASADGEGSALQLVDPGADNNRPSNWTDGAGWKFFSYTGTVGSTPGSRLSLFLTNTGGDVFIDDIAFVQGTVPNAGVNLIANGDFESPLSPPWFKNVLATNSVIDDTVAHGGSRSLHLIYNPGAPQLTHFYQDLTNVVPTGVMTGTVYTISYWFLPGTNSNFLNARLNALFRPVADVRANRSTPGAPNSGATTLPPYPPLWLSEVQPDNVNGISDNAGEVEPWIELYFAGETPLSLDEFYLSDSLSALTRWQFPAGASINPGQFLVVWADGEPGESAGNALHTDFRLNPTNGAVVLSRLVNGAPQVIDYLSYRDVGTNRSYGAFPDGQQSFRQVFYFPTPGGTNDPAAPPIPVFINEWLAANTGVVLDPADSDADDFFELYNAGTNAIDLAGYTLTDNLGSPRKYTIPLGVRIPAGGFLVVWADEESGQTRTNGDLHVNFRLGQGGETLALFEPGLAGRIVDAVTFGAQAGNVSQGRWRDGAAPPYFSMPTPTPGAPNVVPAPELRILGVPVVAGNTVTLTWQAEPGRTYRLLFKNGLHENIWSEVPGDVTATGSTASKVDSSIDGISQRFYRIHRLP